MLEVEGKGYSSVACALLSIGAESVWVGKRCESGSHFTGGAGLIERSLARAVIVAQQPATHGGGVVGA